MSPESDSFAAHYAQCSQPELLALARTYEDLTEPAKDALRSEFAHRKLDPPLVDEDDGPAVSRRSLVTLHRYRDLSEAIVARSMLEAAGIPVYLRDENLVRLDWQISNFIGGIRLQVEVSDAPAATELLNQPVSESIAIEGEPDFEQPHCPHCGSAQITFEGANRTVAITSVFVLGVPLPLGRETWLCDNCGTRWEDTNATP